MDLPFGNLTINNYIIIGTVSGNRQKQGTNVGGSPEVVDDGRTGIHIPPGDVDALCKAIEYLIKNPGVRWKWGKKEEKKSSDNLPLKKM